MNASAFFFARYVLGDPSLFVPIILILVLGGTAVAAPLVPFLVARFGKKGCFQFGSLLAAVGFLAVFLAPPSSPALVFAALMLAAVGAMVPMTVVWALEADTVEYGEWATGERWKLSALISSASSSRPSSTATHARW